MIASLVAHAELLGLTPHEADDYISQIAITLFGGKLRPEDFLVGNY